MPVSYFEEQINRDDLMQGDVLKRTPEFDAILEKVHQHYIDAKNRYFMVLTQSCDLVERSEGSVKAPYIIVAPVRSLDAALDKYVREYERSSVSHEVPIIGEKCRIKLVESLGRLFNNNEPNYFYLDASGTELTTDCVAVLRLSIAIKTSLHLDTCKQAKILQLKEIFQTKLGWLVGQLYSRVGTEDWNQQELSRKRNKIVDRVAVWVSEDKLPELEVRLTRSVPERERDRSRIARAVKSLPKPKEKFAKRAEEVLSEMSDDIRGRFRHREGKIDKAIDGVSEIINELLQPDQGEARSPDTEAALARVRDEFRKCRDDMTSLLELYVRRLAADPQISTYVSK
jgi:hypothetical protein